MTQKHKEASMKFIEHFGYYPNHPNDIDFDQDAYAEELLKCVEEGVSQSLCKPSN